MTRLVLLYVVLNCLDLSVAVHLTTGGFFYSAIGPSIAAALQNPVIWWTISMSKAAIIVVVHCSTQRNVQLLCILPSGLLALLYCITIVV